MTELSFCNSIRGIYDTIPTHPLVLAFGGGTNSLGVLIGFKRLNIRPDLITFSDTKGEKPETYKAVEVADEWCKKVGFPGITTVRTVSPTLGFEGLEGMVLRLGTLPSKAFGFKACSQRFKIEAQHKFLNSWGPAKRVWTTCDLCGRFKVNHNRTKVSLTGAESNKLADELDKKAGRLYEKRKDVFGDADVKTRAEMAVKIANLVENARALRDGDINPGRAVFYCPSKDSRSRQEFRGKKILQVIGYDAGEPQRAKNYENEKFRFWYPLIEWGWGREECVQAIKEEGLPQPGKSACFFCPSMRKPEVIALSKQHPDLFDRAVAMERNALSSGKLGVVKGLGRHWSWEELVAASEEQRRKLPENHMGIDCACFDGEPEDDEDGTE